MKKIFFIAISFCSAVTVFAQEPADALRYSWTNQGGTARQQALGGAMGSLGGDLFGLIGRSADDEGESDERHDRERCAGEERRLRADPIP